MKIIPKEFLLGTMAIRTGERWAPYFLEDAKQISDRRYPNRVLGHPYEDPEELAFSRNGWCCKSWYENAGYKIVNYEDLENKGGEPVGKEPSFEDIDSVMI